MQEMSQSIIVLVNKDIYRRSIEQFFVNENNISKQRVFSFSQRLITKQV